MEGKLSGPEQAELGRLQGAVSQIENALRFSAGMDAATMDALSAFLAHLQGRLSGLEAKAEEQAREERTQAEQEARISALVERERALNEAEKQEYASFLSEDRFKKADFDRLEHFYSHSWDKLTEEGKDEMSHRVCEGVRHGEYRFSELPDPVKEKEAQQVQCVMENAVDAGSERNAIPEVDRTDFIRARKAGDRQQSYLILDRPSFSLHVATETSVTTVARGVESKSERFLQAEAQFAVQPAPEPGPAPSMGRKNLELPTDLKEVPDPTANLLAPRTVTAVSQVVKTRD